MILLPAHKTAPIGITPEPKITPAEVVMIIFVPNLAKGSLRTQ
jgi:hypothetical protein